MSRVADRIRALLHRRGGAMPEYRPVPGEERVVLSPGWNGSTVEHSGTYSGRGLTADRKPPTA
jgi:hypothetical protein